MLRMTPLINHLNECLLAAWPLCLVKSTCSLCGCPENGLRESGKASTTSMIKKEGEVREKKPPDVAK